MNVIVDMIARAILNNVEHEFPKNILGDSLKKEAIWHF